MTASVQAFMRPEPKRDRYGRPLIKGKAFTRVTTLAETLDDRYNLELWKVRKGGVGLTVRPDLYARVAACRPDDKKALDSLMSEAIEAAKASEGANLGTALHAFTERIDLGEELAVPPPWDADIAAYRQALADHRITILPEWVERMVLCEELGVAGTPDRRVEHRGRITISDLKTGATLDFSWCAIAVQLACYANARLAYNPVADEVIPITEDVDTNTALVIHLPAGKATCTIYEVDIAAGWEAAKQAMWVRDWRKRKNLATPVSSFEIPSNVTPLRPPADEPSDLLAGL